MKKLCIGIATVIVFMLMVHGSAIAQSILSSITGTVTDPSGHVVSGAKVVAHETATGVDRSEQSNGVGVYSIVGLLPGTYVVTVSKSGFKDERSGEIILIAAQAVKFDAPLLVGSNTETIEVTATPPSMNTENGELDDLITGSEARADALMPSIFQVLAIDPASVTHGSTVMLGDQRAPYGNPTIDGVTTMNNIYGGTSGGMTENQSFDSIAEIKMTENNGAADTPGFASEIVTTKSGTNKYHGDAFWTTDNSALDSTPFFTPSTARLKGPEIQVYGGSVGGPVVIPHVYNGHKKTFFYVTWIHWTFPLAAGEAYVNQVTLPSANFEAGNFSQLLPGITVSNPSTGAPYTNNTISGSGPFTTISSVAQAFQSNYFPTAPATFGIDDYSNLITEPEHINREDYKIDHNFSERSILSGRYTRMYDYEPNNYTSGATILGYHLIKTFQNAYLSHTYTITPNLVNVARASFSKDDRVYAPFHNGQQVLTATGLEGVTVAPSLLGFPAIYFGSSEIEQMAEIGQTTAISNYFQIGDDITWQKRRHSIKAGISLTDTRPQASSGDGVQQLGSMTFNGFASGYDYADFLLGIPSSVSLNENPPNRYNRSINTGIYGQDTWTVSPKLSVNLGLRWDYYQPPVDNNDRRANFDPYYTSATGGYVGGIVLPDAKALTYLNPALPTVIPDDMVEISPLGFPGRSMLNGNHADFGPRLGFAYQFDPRTVIRGGWGMYYGILVASVQDNLAGGGVFGTALSAVNTIDEGTPAFTFPNPFTTVAPSAGSLACTITCGLVEQGTDPHIKTPTSQEYNLTLERELGHQIVARVGYRGFNTYHLPYTRDLTIPQAGSNGNLPGNTTGSNSKLSVYPLYSKVTWTQSGAVSRENSLEAALVKKFSGGLNFDFGYSLVKNLTDDNGGGGGDGEGDNPENPYNLKADYGNTEFIPRHRFVATTLYNLPVGKGKRFGANMPAVLDEAIGGWEVSNIFLFQTGQFLTPYYDGVDSYTINPTTPIPNTAFYQQNIRGDGANLRPNCTGNWSVPHAVGSKWFNNTPWYTTSGGVITLNPLAVFSAPALGQYGNCGTGIIQGPGVWGDNIGLHKYFPLRGTVRLEFKADFMNAFNHPNPGNPNVDISNFSAFGVIPKSTQSGNAELNPSAVNDNGERHIWLTMRVEF